MPLPTTDPGRTTSADFFHDRDRLALIKLGVRLGDGCAAMSQHGPGRVDAVRAANLGGLRVPELVRVPVRDVRFHRRPPDCTPVALDRVGVAWRSWIEAAA